MNSESFSRRPLACWTRRLVLLGVLATTGGCALWTLSPAPDPDRLTAAVALPEHWRQTDARTPEAASAPVAHDAWWRELNDARLNALIEEGLARAPDLRLALARLRQARENRNASAASWWPTLSASVSASRAPGAATREQSKTAYQAGFDASWEPDLFGVTRHGVAASEADLAAAGVGVEQAQVSLASEIALNYVDYRMQQERLRIACRNAEIQQESFDIARWRAEAGLVTDLDVEQARASLAQTKAAIPSLQNSGLAALNRLDVLLGNPPGRFAAAEGVARADAPCAGFARMGEREPVVRASAWTAPHPLPAPPATIVVGIPAEALYRRPDVKSAELSLISAIERVHAARAERFPSLRLSGSLSWKDTRFTDLVNPETLVRSLIASLATSLFDGGRIGANIRAQDAVAEQALIAYEQTLLTSLEEVENALAAYAAGRRREAELVTAATAAQNAARLASQMYQSGLNDFQTVLTAERTLFSAEDALASARGDILGSVIQLHKALGGGWTPVDVETAGESAEKEKAPDAERAAGASS